MTTASKGLAKALGRSSSGDTIALAEMTTDDLLANLSDERKAELSAALAPLNAAAMPKKDDPKADPNEAEPDGDDDDKDKAKASIEATPLASNASINARVQAVAAAVASDGPCKGKAGLALAMLADDDFASLNAAAIVKIIGTSGASDAGADPESGARAEMKAAIKETRNSNIAPGPGTGASADDNGAAGWSKATAEVNRRNGFKD